MLRSLVGALTFAALATMAPLARAEPPAPFADTAIAAIEIADASGVSIRARLLGVAPVPAHLTGDDALRIYPRAFGDADLERRVDDMTTEDVVRYPTKPAREAIDYEVALDNVAGVRLVAGSVEFRDEEGIPRLRMSPPFITDARGVRHDATVDVDGCRISTDPRPPWRTPVVAPGSSSCKVHVRWSIDAYPAVLDPAWTSTKQHMNVARLSFALIEMGVDIYAIGGLTTGDVPTATTEVFNPKHQTWAMTQPMNFPRRDLGATKISPTEILIAGGCCSSTDCGTCPNTAEVFDVDAKTVNAIGLDLSPHEVAAAIQVIDTDSGKPIERAVVLGGASASVDVYTPGATNPWVSESPPSWNGRLDFTATPFPDAGSNSDSKSRISLLVCGGRDTNTVVHAECFLRRDGRWTQEFMMAVPRQAHTAIATSEPGNPPRVAIVIAGGDHDGTTEFWEPLTGTQKSLGPLLSPRHHAAIAVRQSNVVVVSGGTVDGPDTITPSAEGIAPTLTGGWFSRDNMVNPRRDHAMIRVDAIAEPPLLVAGGYNGRALDTSELLAPLSDNMACTKDGQCESNHCKNGTCCGCGTCRLCTPNGCMDNQGGTDDACPPSNDVHACSRRGECGAHGNCATFDCGLGACLLHGCHLGACTTNDECAPGAECRFDSSKGERRCLCNSNEACLAGEVCMEDGTCDKKFDRVTPEQISCALSEPATGTFASLVVAAFALAVRRRRQKGTVAKISGKNSKNGP